MMIMIMMMMVIMIMMMMMMVIMLKQPLPEDCIVTVVTYRRIPRI